MTTQIADLYKSDRKEIGHLIGTFMFISFFNLAESLYNAFVKDETSLVIFFYVAVISFCFKLFYDREKYQHPDATCVSMFLSANYICLILLCINTYLAVVSADLVFNFINDFENLTIMDHVETGCFVFGATLVYSLLCHIEKKQGKK